MFIDGVLILGKLSPAIAYKVNFYSFNQAGYTPADLYYQNRVIILCILVAATLSCTLQPAIRSFILVNATLYFTLLPYPLMSLRVPLAMTAILAGAFSCYLLQSWKTLYAIGLTIVLFFSVFGQLPMQEQKSASMATWGLFRPASDRPFYYLFALLATRDQSLRQP